MALAAYLSSIFWWLAMLADKMSTVVEDRLGNQEATPSRPGLPPRKPYNHTHDDDWRTDMTRLCRILYVIPRGLHVAFYFLEWPWMTMNYRGVWKVYGKSLKLVKVQNIIWPAMWKIMTTWDTSSADYPLLFGPCLKLSISITSLCRIP